MNNTTTTNTTALAIFSEPSLGDMYASFRPDSMDGKIRLYNAINSPENRIADCINKEITVKDVIVKLVKLAADRTASAENWEEQDRDGFRVILIDMDGVAYTATSSGIYNSVATIRSIFGDLHFDDGLKVMVQQVKTKNGNTLTLKVLG